MALDPLAAIIEAIRGPKYEDTDEYKQGKINETLWYQNIWANEISELNDPPKPVFPESYWKAYSAIPPPPITTFRPWDKKQNFKKYLNDKTNALLKYRTKLQRKIEMANLENTTPLSNFYSTTPEPTTTTFEPWDRNSDEPIWKWFIRKSQEMNKITKLMEKERKEAEESTYETSVDFYVHNREKCFIQLVKIAMDIVGTFMGAFDAYEIQQIKSKF
jgi:hypothetical protein